MNGCHAYHIRALHSRAVLIFGCAYVFTCFSTASASSALRASHRTIVDGPTERQRWSQPAAGDLVGQVKGQLAIDHRTLGMASQALLSVQGKVDYTERSMLGKVLDLQTARTFFSRHERIETANDKLKSDVSMFNKEVEGLSSTLSEVQRKFLTTARANRKAEDHLQSEIIEDDTLIRNLNTALAKEDEVQVALRKLEDIHRRLLAEADEAARAGEKSATLLRKERAASTGELGRHKSLRDQLVTMSNYSIACHANVEKASKKLGHAMVAEARDDKAAELTLKQKTRAITASEQRLLAERALLTSEVKKVESEDVQEIERVKDLREDFQTLELNIVAEMRSTGAKINAEKARLETLKASLLENTQAELEDVAAQEALDAQIAKLINFVKAEQNPITIATIEAQNDALHIELGNAYALWKTAQQAETAARLNVDEAQGASKASKKELQNAEEAARAARKMSHEKMVEAVKVAATNKAKSLALIQKAQAAVAARCKSKWDAIWKCKRAQLKKCRALKEDLTMEKAKKSSLVETLKAKAEAT